MIKLVTIFIVVGMFLPHPSAAQTADTDNDGLADEVEIALGTDAAAADTDGDGFTDGTEAYTGHNPLKGAGDRSLVRWVEVDLGNQKMDYFLGGVRIGAIPVSTGRRGTPTPIGEFKILRKRPSVHYRGAGYSYPNTKWNLEFLPHYYLHGAYWHKQFGRRAMSRGCVNIAYKDAEKLYQFLDAGDAVKITGKTPAGLVKL